MKIMTNDLVKHASRELDATELVMLAKRDWDKIKESSLADGVVFMVLRSVD